MEEIPLHKRWLFYDGVTVDTAIMEALEKGSVIASRGGTAFSFTATAVSDSPLVLTMYEWGHLDDAGEYQAPVNRKSWTLILQAPAESGPPSRDWRVDEQRSRERWARMGRGIFAKFAANLDADE